MIKGNNYKVFYNDNFVAEFDTLKSAKEYIYDMLKVDKELDINDFEIYSKL